LYIWKEGFGLEKRGVARVSERRRRRRRRDSGGVGQLRYLSSIFCISKMIN